MTRPRLRAALGTALLAGALVGGLSGCTTPEPDPTSSALFASEDEAFAAAEKTYRAYVDALNAVDLSDPETFEGVYAWTTGDANAGARESFSQMHADGWNVSGLSKFDSFAGLTYERGPEGSSVTAEACLDVSDVKVVDKSGSSVVPEARRNRQPVIVTFVGAGDELLIGDSEATERDTCG